MSPVLKVSVIIEHDGKLLLIKEKFKAGTKPGWNLCGGGWEEEDGDLKATAIREAREESGLDVEVVGLYGVAVVKLTQGHALRFFFVCRALTTDVELLPKEEQEKLNEEIVGFQWFSHEEVSVLSDDAFVSSTVASVIKTYARVPQHSPAEQVLYFENETKF
jgi:ADP-ribose pyrophosphatase YjhB (NUDIX family)